MGGVAVKGYKDGGLVKGYKDGSPGGIKMPEGMQTLPYKIDPEDKRSPEKRLKDSMIRGPYVPDAEDKRSLKDRMIKMSKDDE
jgi:hypothetical protein